ATGARGQPRDLGVGWRAAGAAGAVHVRAVHAHLVRVGADRGAGVGGDGGSRGAGAAGGRGRQGAHPAAPGHGAPPRPRAPRLTQTGSRTRGHVMQWPPPRPRPSSAPTIVTTSTPACRSAALVRVLRS